MADNPNPQGFGIGPGAMEFLERYNLVADTAERYFDCNDGSGDRVTVVKAHFATPLVLVVTFYDKASDSWMTGAYFPGGVSE